jgi:hypothetical protein
VTIIISVGHRSSCKQFDINGNPASLPTAGGLVTLTAVAFDIDDEPIEGATVVFNTTSGTLQRGFRRSLMLTEKQRLHWLLSPTQQGHP